MQKDRIWKFLTIILGLIIVINFIFRVNFYKKDIFRKFDSKYWTKRYQESQWVIPNSKNPIGDDGLYMYAGYRYIQGDDPSLLNAEMPPLGKYLIGIFEVTTGFIGIFSMFFSGISLILLYIFNKKVFKSSFFALIPIALFSVEPIFPPQINAPYLDTLYLSLLLLGFIFLLNKKYLFTGIIFGLFMSVKSPILVIVVYASIITWLIFKKEFSLRKLLIMVLPTFFVFILTYTSTFLHGHNLLYFLKVQKYILHFYSSGAKPVIGAVFPMIFSGTWFTWFGSIQRVSEWNIIWPIALILTGIGGYLGFRKKYSIVVFQLIWIVFYLTFLSFTPIFARYLLLLLPFLYNLSIWVLYAVLRSKSSSAWY